MKNSEFEKKKLDGWLRWHGDMPEDEIPAPNHSYEYGFKQGFYARQAQIESLEKQLSCANRGHNYQPSIDGGTLVCECGAWK